MSDVKWDGEGKPPVGAHALVHNDPGYHISYGVSVIGKKVEVKALFYSGDVPMAAVERGGECFCFRVEMLRPIRSAEDKVVEAMLRSAPWADEDADDFALCSALYAAIRDGNIPGVKLEDTP